MLVSISTTYLACNILSVLIACWEFVDKESLFTPTLRPLYTYSTDLVSLLTLVSCASRLPIYYKCNVRRRSTGSSFDCATAARPSRRFSRENTNMGGTIRYLNAGNGYVFYNAAGAPLSPNEKHHLNGQCFGTGFDKVSYCCCV
ncbi:hypothetical protein M3Y99_00199700 [Aphelenchoides fujianensis]|nr:hypothetical protein M3Y99_00199700 [Aphelenchoides fujianensis]